jgi:type I restriction enzyme S subunit
MSSKWPQVPLESLVSFINRGVTPSYVPTGGILVINQKCIRNWCISLVEAKRTDPSRKSISADRLLCPLDILVNSTGVGTVGRVAQVGYLPEAATADSHVTIIRPNSSKVVPEFLGYVLKLKEAEIESLSEGTTGQTELSRTQLKVLSIPLPDKKKQTAIAEILTALDKKIDINRQKRETIETIARTIFRSWFLSFEPVRVKTQGGDPSLPTALAKLFPSSFKTSTFGQVPQGWKVTQLGIHVSIAKGLSYKGDDLASSGVPFHNLNSISEGGGYKYNGIKYYTGGFAERHKVEPGDLIVANTEQGHERLLIGYAAIVPRLFGTAGVFSHHLYRVRVNESDGISPFFLCLLLNSPAMHEIISGFANGTTVNMLPIGALKDSAFVLPPSPLLRAFNAIVKPLFDRSEVLEAENQTLRAFRNALLPKLISGDVTTNHVDWSLKAGRNKYRSQHSLPFDS